MPLQEIEKMESQLNSMIIPALNKLILHLAKCHSKDSFKSVKAILEKPLDMPEEFSNLISNIEEKD